MAFEVLNPQVGITTKAAVITSLNENFAKSVEKETGKSLAPDADLAKLAALGANTETRLAAVESRAEKYKGQFANLAAAEAAITSPEAGWTFVNDETNTTWRYDDNPAGWVDTGLAASGETGETIVAKIATVDNANLVSDTEKTKVGLLSYYPNNYGAIGDNATDNTAAFAATIAAMSAGDTLAIPAGSYKVASTITINKAINIRFEGGKLTTTGNIPIFTVAANGVSFEKPYFVGSGKADGTAPLQKGISIDGYHSFVINCPVIEDIAGDGIYIANTNNGTNRRPGKVVNPLIINSNVGIRSGVRGEYIDITSPNISQCITALRIMGGNVTVSGGAIFDNTTGVYLESGTNHGHGSVTGCLINHNTTCVYADTVTLGFGFIGCHIIDGLVHLKDSSNIVFQGCPQLAVSWRFEGGERNHIRNSCIRKLVGYAVENNYNSNQSHVEWTDNYSYPGDTPLTFLETIKGGYFSGQESVQSFATGSSGEVAYTVVKQSTSNNDVQTKYVFWDNTNKNILAPGLSSDSRKRVKLLLKFTLLNTADLKKLFIYFRTVDATVRTLGYCQIVPFANDGTTTSYNVIFDGILNVASGEKIRLTVNNASGQTVSITGTSGERTLQIEGL